MKKITLILFAFVLVSSAFAQQFQLDGQRLPAYRSAALKQHFREYSVFRLDAGALLDFAAQTRGDFNLKFGLDGLPAVQTAMHSSAVVSEHYLAIGQERPAAAKRIEQPEVFTCLGIADGNKADKVAITVAQDFIYGFYEKSGERFYIEPLRYFVPNAPADYFVVYNGNYVNWQEGLVCSPIEIKSQAIDLPEGTQPGPENCKPLELEIAIANDYQMVQKYGTVTAVYTHNIAVMNSAQANWDDEFAKPVLFKITAQFAPSSAAADPFPTSNKRDDLINFFRDWANGGGFGAASFDLGHWRTPRKVFNPSNQQIAGATFLNQVCTDHRYSIFSETGSVPFIACELRTTVSHEMGHSFNASHTPQSGNDIMRPVLACSDVWLPVSISEIDARMATATCMTLSNCIPQPPALPESLAFICTPDEECYTFTAPCAGGYNVSTNDPNLQVTTTGTTICLKSLVEGYRVARVYVSAFDHCGRYDPMSFGVAWSITIDDEAHCPGLRGSEDRNQANTFATGSLTMRHDNHYLRIEDQNPVARTKDIQIYDLSGKLLLHQEDASAQIQQSLENLPQGLYLVRVFAGSDVLVAKISHW